MEPELHIAQQAVPVEHVAEHAVGHAAEPWYFDPTFWVALAFAGFVLVFLRYAWPAIAKLLDARAAKIRDQLEQAAKLKTEAEALLKTYEKQKKAMQKEARSIVEDAKREAENIRIRAAEELQSSLARRREQAEEKVARAQADATTKIRAQLIEIATQAARQVVGLTLKDRKDDPAVARAITAIERQLH